MVARTILTKRQDVAVDRIEAHANSIAGEHPRLPKLPKGQKCKRS